MRWLLLPLLLLAFLAPAGECSRNLVVRWEGQAYIPPLTPGEAGFVFGTDQDGRDLSCALPQAARQSMLLGFLALLIGALPGLVLGLWMGWRRRTFGFSAEIFLLAVLLFLLGPTPERYLAVLAFGVVLFVARAVSVRTQAIWTEPYIEAARALGAEDGRLLHRHVWPHLKPVMPGFLSLTLGQTYIWMAELAALSLFFGGGFAADLGGGLQLYALVPELAQMLSEGRYAWLYAPHLLAFPALLLMCLGLAFNDLGRLLGNRKA